MWLESFGPEHEVAGVTLVSTGEAVEWSRPDDRLAITAPAVEPDTPAVAFAIHLGGAR